MINNVLGFEELIVLMPSAAVIYLTSKWSCLPLVLRFSLALVTAIVVFFCIPHGLAHSKPAEMLYNAPAFYSWGLGLWCGLVLVRAPRFSMKVAGCIFTCIFGLHPRMHSLLLGDVLKCLARTV